MQLYRFWSLQYAPCALRYDCSGRRIAQDEDEIVFFASLFCLNSFVAIGRIPF